MFRYLQYLQYLQWLTCQVVTLPRAVWCWYQIAYVCCAVILQYFIIAPSTISQCVSRVIVPPAGYRDNERVSPRPRHRIAGYKKSLNSHRCCKEAHYVQWIHYDFPSMCKEMIKLQFLLLGCSHDQCPRPAPCPGSVPYYCHTGHRTQPGQVTIMGRHSGMKIHFFTIFPKLLSDTVIDSIYV